MSTDQRIPSSVGPGDVKKIKAFDVANMGRIHLLPGTPVNSPFTFTRMSTPMTGMMTEKESMVNQIDSTPNSNPSLSQSKAADIVDRYTKTGEDISTITGEATPTAFQLEQTREHGAADDARRVLSEQSKMHIFGLATTGALLIAIACAFRP